MSVQIECISKCCGAKIRVEGGAPDFIGSNYVCTMCYVCTHCGKPCDWQEKNIANKKDLKEFEKIIDDNIDVFKRLAKK
jgi:hypothetical protein